MSKRFTVAVGVLALTLLGCAPKPEMNPTEHTPTKANAVTRTNEPAANSSQVRKVASVPANFLGGVIEGYYGPPWSPEDTVHMIDFLAAHHMNTFVYAPKDDPYQRDKWNLLYPDSRLGILKTLIRTAKRDGVHFVYSISPGLSITYSSAKDRAALTAKVDQLRKLGVDVFMFSFDDIWRGLNNADLKRYGNDMAHAQSELTNVIYTHEVKLDPAFRVIFTPTQYAGTDNKPYWQSLKKYLNAKVPVVWTGPGVLSPTIDAQSVKNVTSYVGHPLVIWDNYPVNDYTIVGDKHPKLFMGPVINRDATIPKLVAGYLYNPMDQERASELAVWTGGDYLFDPAHYQPQQSWQTAIRSLGGPASQDLQTFVENSSSYYRDDTPPAQLAADVSAFWTAQANGTASDLTKTALYQDFQALKGVDAGLASGLPDKSLYAEIRPWSSLLSLQGRVGVNVILALQAKQSGTLTSADVSSLRSMLTQLEQNPYSIADGVVRGFVTRTLNSLS